jgi:uncharacterized membrane-anchored protein
MVKEKKMFQDILKKKQFVIFIIIILLILFTGFVMKMVENLP